MRSLVRFVLVASGIAILAGVQPAEAQVTGPVEFTTTFPFSVGNATVPAGSYRITPDEDNPRFLQLTGQHTAMFFEVRDEQATRRPVRTEVVFARYGGGYVLKHVWIQGSESGAEAVTFEPERHHAKAGQSTGEERVAAKPRKRV